jgi:hypothetical protein
MDSDSPPEPTSVGMRLPETRTLVGSVMALLDIARLEIDKDPYVAKASIVRASALLVKFANLAAAPTTSLNAERPHGECRP